MTLQHRRRTLPPDTAQRRGNRGGSGGQIPPRRGSNDPQKLTWWPNLVFWPPYFGKKYFLVKADIALHGNPISELRDVTCHMGSHSVTCHQTQVNVPRLTPAMQAGTRFTCPEGWKA